MERQHFVSTTVKDIVTLTAMEVDKILLDYAIAKTKRLHSRLSSTDTVINTKSITSTCIITINREDID